MGWGNLGSAPGPVKRKCRGHRFRARPARVGYDVDLHAACPEGASSWQNQQSFGDLLFNLVTLGIYSPRTVPARAPLDGARGAG